METCVIVSPVKDDFFTYVLVETNVNGERDTPDCYVATSVIPCPTFRVNLSSGTNCHSCSSSETLKYHWCVSDYYFSKPTRGPCWRYMVTVLTLVKKFSIKLIKNECKNYLTRKITVTLLLHTLNIVRVFDFETCYTKF